MTMPHTATRKQLELALWGDRGKAASRSILPRRMVRKRSFVRGQRTRPWELTRNGVEYQYRREVNPKSLRPIAQRLFNRWTVVRALHTEADYRIGGPGI